MDIQLSALTTALHNSWPVWEHEPESGYWSKENPARGQCVPSSLVVQDYYGGDIVRVRVTGDGIDETHYFNVLEDGTILDTTGSQYRVPVALTPAPIDLKKYSANDVRERLLNDEGTRIRYATLKSRVADCLTR